MKLDYNHEVISWLTELLDLEENECARYSSSIVLLRPREGSEGKFEYHQRKIKLLRAARSMLLGTELLRKPAVTSGSVIFPDIDFQED